MRQWGRLGRAGHKFFVLADQWIATEGGRRGGRSRQKVWPFAASDNRQFTSLHMYPFVSLHPSPTKPWRAASRVRATSSAVWAAETKAASNWEGDRKSVV